MEVPSRLRVKAEDNYETPQNQMTAQYDDIDTRAIDEPMEADHDFEEPPKPKPKAKKTPRRPDFDRFDDLDESEPEYKATRRRKEPVRRLRVIKPLISLRSIITLPSRPPRGDVVPLLKKRAGDKQRPMAVDVQRIITESTKDRRLRVNTLDVLRQLVVNHDPKIHKNRFINEEATHNELRQYLLSQLDLIADTHGSIRDIANDILRIQREKNELRKKIYDLRNDHAKVGADLDRLRLQYNQEKTEYQAMDLTMKQFEALNTLVKNGEQSSVPDIDHRLHEISRVVNPLLGLHQKVTLINNKLAAIDYEMQ